MLLILKKKIIEDLGFKIFGVSKDNIEKHKKFKQKYSLDLSLISDENGDICNAFQVWVEKSMYGKNIWVLKDLLL